MYNSLSRAVSLLLEELYFRTECVTDYRGLLTSRPRGGGGGGAPHTATLWRRAADRAGTNFALGSYIPANSHGFPGSLQIFYQISCSPGYSTKSPKSKQGETQKS